MQKEYPMQKLRSYTKKERNFYLIGLAGQNVLYGISSVLAYYFQFTLLIPAMTVSVLLTFNQLFDAVKDPVMGNLMDRTRTKWGKARPFLLFSPIPAGVFLLLCFTGRVYDPALGMTDWRNLLGVVWAFSTCLLFGLAFTAGDVPIHSLPNLMTEDEQARTKLVSMKMIAMLTAIIGEAVMPLSLQAKNFFIAGGRGIQQAEKNGFFLVAVPMILFGAGAFQLTGLFVQERVALHEKTNSIWENLMLLWKNKPFRAILVSGLLASVKSVEIMGTLPLYTYYYANKEPLKIVLYTLLLGGGSFIGKAFSARLTPHLVRRYEKSRLFVAVNLLSALPMLLIYLLYCSAPGKMANPTYIVLTALCYTVGGTLFAIQTITVNLLTSDAVDYEEYYTNIRPDGMLASGQTITVKVGAGISSLISGAVFAVTGFSGQRVADLNTFIDAGGIARHSAVFAADMRTLFFLATVPSVIGAILCALPMLCYPLADTEHRRILDELNTRRHESDSEYL